MREIDECDMEMFGTLYQYSEKTSAILGDRWWPQPTKQEEGKTSKTFLCNIWKRTERPSIGGVSEVVSLLGIGTVLGLGGDAWSMVK